jgi:hypothetical protein
MTKSAHASRVGVALFWLVSIFVALSFGYLGRGWIEASDVDMAAVIRPENRKAVDLISALASPPRGQATEPCPVCGSARDVYITICPDRRVCFDLTRCRRCGTLAALQRDLEGQALVGTDGDSEVVDENGRILEGDDALEFLRRQGKAGAVLAYDGTVPVIREVIRGSAADVAGLVKGDRIEAVESVKCTESRECLDPTTLLSRSRGEMLSLRVRRGGAIRTVILRHGSPSGTVQERRHENP